MIKTSPVERVDNLSKEAFLLNYKRAEKPVVIENLTKNWPARKNGTLNT